MKKYLITVLLIIGIALNGYSKTMPIKSVPIILEPIAAPLATTFWGLMVLAGAVSIAESLAEPLPNFECKAQYEHRITVERTSWPDGDYGTRVTTRERTYSLEPVSRVVSWWTKTTLQIFPRPGSNETNITTNITYDQSPPAVVEFTNMDVKYQRFALSGSHQSSYAYEGTSIVTYCIVRRGHWGWPRPVTGTIGKLPAALAWNWVPVFRNDVLFHSPTVNYIDDYFTLIGPDGWVAYKPHWEGNTELPAAGQVSTLREW